METNNNTITKQNIMEAARTWKRLTPLKKGPKSKLTQHSDTIRYLRSSRHMSYTEICEFFNSQGIQTSYQNLLSFIKKNKIGK